MKSQYSIVQARLNGALSQELVLLLVVDVLRFTVGSGPG